MTVVLCSAASDKHNSRDCDLKSNVSSDSRPKYLAHLAAQSFTSTHGSEPHGLFIQNILEGEQQSRCENALGHLGANACTIVSNLLFNKVGCREGCRRKKRRKKEYKSIPL